MSVFDELDQALTERHELVLKYSEIGQRLDDNARRIESARLAVFARLKAIGITDRIIAQKLGVSPITVGHWRTGRFKSSRSLSDNLAPLRNLLKEAEK